MKDNGLFSDVIFEAKVVDIDYDNGTCSINPNSANPANTIDGVPIPQTMGGFGNAGVFGPLYYGTRVIAAQVDGRSRETTVILHILPSTELLERNFDSFISDNPSSVPVGLYPYPTVVPGRMIIRGGAAENSLILSELGDVELSTVTGGLFIKNDEVRVATTIVSEDLVQYTNSGRIVSGPVRRMRSAQATNYPAPALSEVSLFADPNYSRISDPIGFFTGSPAQEHTFDRSRRNPAISEYRVVINEFTTDSMFTGFDDEVDRVNGNLSLYDNSETLERNRQQGNTLHLAEHELIEIIGGNVLDINGNVLDINYRKLEYGTFESPGGPRNIVPTTTGEAGYEIAKRVSRRGIGYHFQLTTNTTTNEPSTNTSSFIFDVDKEGLLKVNVPASSDTGNVPFASLADFRGTGDNVDVSYHLASTSEKVPATLRDFGGNVIFPEKVEAVLQRETGIRFKNSDENPYFPPVGETNKEFVRVNLTKYHNMYAAAERLIANTITEVKIPKPWGSPDGEPEGISSLRPFEWKKPSILDKDESSDDPKTNTDKFKEDRRTAIPTYMSIVFVDPAEPAINPGGDTVVAGYNYRADEYEPLSNSFSLTAGEDFESPIVNDIDVLPTGGQSAHLNFEGSIVASVGKDNVDGKSITLDTNGSVVSWFGKDDNDRSLIMQTDGSMLVNVGGSYVNNEINKGRFDLRVNVTNQGFINEDAPELGSDIIISLSENGIIIAGMNPNIPMIIRNDARILIESASSEVVLKGTSIKTVGPSGEKVLKPSSAGSQSPAL